MTASWSLRWLMIGLVALPAPGCIWNRWTCCTEKFGCAPVTFHDFLCEPDPCDACGNYVGGGQPASGCDSCDTGWASMGANRPPAFDAAGKATEMAARTSGAGLPVGGGYSLDGKLIDRPSDIAGLRTPPEFVAGQAMQRPVAQIAGHFRQPTHFAQPALAQVPSQPLAPQRMAVLPPSPAGNWNAAGRVQPQLATGGMGVDQASPGSGGWSASGRVVPGPNFQGRPEGIPGKTTVVAANPGNLVNGQMGAGNWSESEYVLAPSPAPQLALPQVANASSTTARVATVPKTPRIRY